MHFILLGALQLADPWPNERLTVRVGDCTWMQWSVRMTYINQIGCGNLLYVSHVQLYS